MNPRAETDIRYLIRIDAPDEFCAGVEVSVVDDRIRRCAPILSWSLGSPARKLTNWAKYHGWTVDVIGKAKAIAQLKALSSGTAQPSP